MTPEDPPRPSGPLDRGATGEHNIQERRIRRAIDTNAQPWGRFLLGLLVRILVILAVAALVFGVLGLLRA